MLQILLTNQSPEQTSQQRNHLKVETELTDVGTGLTDGEDTAAGVGRGVGAGVPGEHPLEDAGELWYLNKQTACICRNGSKWWSQIPWIPDIGVVGADAGAAGTASYQAWTVDVSIWTQTHDIYNTHISIEQLAVHETLIVDTDSKRQTQQHMCRLQILRPWCIRSPSRKFLRRSQ